MNPPLVARIFLTEKSPKLLTLYEIRRKKLIKIFIDISQHIFYTILCASQTQFGKVIFNCFRIGFPDVIGIQIHMLTGFYIDKALWTITKIEVYFFRLIERMEQHDFVFVVF